MMIFLLQDISGGIYGLSRGGLSDVTYRRVVTRAWWDISGGINGLFRGGLSDVCVVVAEDCGYLSS